MKQISPQSQVPTLRGDLVFSSRPTGTGAEVIHIRPIGYHQGTNLHGFELSLARMLDGHRSAHDVVAQANRIGLPLSLSALEGFLAHLEQHELLARTAGEAASAVSPWPERVEWDPFVRMQYQSALKHLRAGRVIEAKSTLERLLGTAPLLDEARGLHAWLQQHPSAVLDGETFTDTFDKAERGWLKGRGRPESLDRDEMRAVRPSYAPYIALATVLVIAAALLLVPIPSRVSVAAQLIAIGTDPVMAPTAGTVVEVLVHDGQTVNAGDPLIMYDDPEGVTRSIDAPAFGTVDDLAVYEGAQLFQDQQLLEIADTRQLRMTARLDPSQARAVRAGQSASIALGTRRAKATIAEVNGRRVVATIDNSSRALEPGGAVLDIDVGPRSLLQRLK